MSAAQVAVHQPTSVGEPPRAPPDWKRAFSNLAREHGFEPLRIEGNVPVDIEGTLYRNGIGRVERFGERYGHWFDGDGAVSAVRLVAGQASGAVKLVRTRGLLREERAGRPLFGGYNTSVRRPIRELFLGDRKNPGNTSVLLWKGRLFALCEAGLPFEVDRADLETLGECDLGVIARAFSAHPHEVPQRKAFYNFGLAKNGPKATVETYELPYEGSARTLVAFDIPGPTLIHDFAATERHLVFTIAPFTMSLWKALFLRRGAMDAGRWRPQDGTEIVVVPIDDPSKMFRVKVDAFYGEHVANAFEDKDALVFDFTRYDDIHGMERYVGKLLAGAVEQPLGSTIARCIVDAKTRRVRFEERFAAACELPRVSPRVDARAHRFMYLTGFGSEEASRRTPFDAIVKLDVERGSATRWSPGASQFVSEAVLVPKAEGATEDDGYLLTMVYDARTDHSHLAILDAKDLAAPPLARAFFDHAIPPGFHGQWVSRPT
jgi:all-trans-8'-apo-beta-carotenal 15,15'-oxygenase